MRDTYQDRILPNSTEKGFKDTLQTWNNIKDDFSNKVVLDIGCNQGYFMVQCLNAGAKRAIGVDLNGMHWCVPILEGREKPLDIAQETFDLWGLTNIKLIEGDWENININEKVDVILCLSTAHYFKNLSNGLRKMFAMDADMLIFEASPAIFVQLRIISKEYNYEIIEEKMSHWNGYTIFKIKKK